MKLTKIDTCFIAQNSKAFNVPTLMFSSSQNELYAVPLFLKQLNIIKDEESFKQMLLGEVCIGKINSFLSKLYPNVKIISKKKLANYLTLSAHKNDEIEEKCKNVASKILTKTTQKTLIFSVKGSALQLSSINLTDGAIAEAGIIAAIDFVTFANSRSIDSFFYTLKHNKVNNIYPKAFSFIETISNVGTKQNEVFAAALKQVFDSVRVTDDIQLVAGIQYVQSKVRKYYTKLRDMYNELSLYVLDIITEDRLKFAAESRIFEFCVKVIKECSGKIPQNNFLKEYE